MSETSPVTVVLVHGAWADASSWRAVIPLLQDAGVPVVAVQNPTSSLADDAKATRNALANVSGPVVLVGHSWGGTVISEAGDDPKVKALVFIAAFAPDAGESTGDQVGKFPAPPGLSTVAPDQSGGLLMSLEGWRQNVAQDLDERDARLLHAVQPPLPMSTFGEAVTAPAWRERDNWYLVSANDRAVSVELQRSLVTQLKAESAEVQASHMSLLSQPRVVADFILRAVRKAAAASSGG